MSKNRSEKEIEKAIKNARSSLKVDGHHISNETMELVRKRLKGEISEEKFLRKIRAGRNIEINITDDISQTGLIEEEYKIIEKSVEKDDENG